MKDLRDEFPGTKYNAIECNCNHFADAFCRVLVGRGLPDYVNRLAWLGSFVSCLFPNEATQQAPVGARQPPSSSLGTTGNVINPGITRRTNAGYSKQGAFGGTGYSLAGTAQHAGERTASPGGLSAQERRDRVRMATLKRLGQSE